MEYKSNAQHAVNKDLSYFKLKDELLQYINQQISELRTEVITMFEEDFNKTLHDVEEEITIIKSRINIQTEFRNKSKSSKNYYRFFHYKC